MSEPNGFEYVLETTNARVTTLIVRKSPNICTLVQKTTAGIGIVDLSEDAKRGLLELLGFTQPAPVQIVDEIIPSQQSALNNDNVFESMKRKPGRPPKAA